MATLSRAAGNGNSSPRRKSHEIAALFEETVLLYLRLASWAAKLYGRGDLSGPRRTVLVSLARTGPQTVAQMARSRAQSRQRLQPLVHALIAEDLLKAVPNPAHKQSPLIVLTSRGRRMVDRIHKIEHLWRSRMNIAASTKQIANTVGVVRAVRLEVDRLFAESRKRRE